MQYTDNLEQSTQHLRKAIPLMSKLGVPITPPNYAVWYEYVTDDNPDLKEKIDTILKSSNGFTENLMADLFNEHVVDISEEKLSRARQQLQSLMADVGQSINTAGNSMEQYQQTLDNCSASLRESNDTEAVLDVITRVSDETANMQRYNRELQERLESARQESDKLKSDLEQARNQALTDPLTNVANRNGFDHFLSKLMKDDGLSDKSHAFLMADIDHFKNVNDTHGHLIGDKVIRFVARTIKNCSRNDDIVARFGGEELAVFMPNTTAQEACHIAEAIRTTIEKGKLVKSGSGEHIGQITISIGVAQLEDEESVEQLIHRADEALYQAKREGRNRVIPHQARG